MQNKYIIITICAILIILVLFFPPNKSDSFDLFVPDNISTGDEFTILPTDTKPIKLENKQINGAITTLSFSDSIIGLKFYVTDNETYADDNQVVTYSEDGKEVAIECIKECEINNQIFVYNDYYNIPYFGID